MTEKATGHAKDTDKKEGKQICSAKTNRTSLLFFFSSWLLNHKQKCTIFTVYHF